MNYTALMNALGFPEGAVDVSEEPRVRNVHKNSRTKILASAGISQ
jgi:hypothetical protein